MTASPDHDEWLMAQVANGRRQCLETLIRRHASRLLTFLQRMVSDAHRAEDIFQDVFLTVWVKRHQYQYPRPFKPWLYTIAANRCRALARSRRPQPVPLDEDAPCPHRSSDPSAEDSAVATETAHLVSTAVTRLPDQQRAVVVLRIWEGLSYAEIAAMLGRTEATVRSHMHHGLAALRQYLEPRLQ
jgi:RNA polymerase sigma-70 factor (ECF subfamily)